MPSRIRGEVRPGRPEPRRIGAVLDQEMTGPFWRARGIITSRGRGREWSSWGLVLEPRS